MKCKKIYIGEELIKDDWEFGLGSIYLAGPRNKESESWRLDFISKIEATEIPVSLLIPETRPQLKNGASSTNSMVDRFAWNDIAISVASAVVFWFPSDADGINSFVEFGSLSKADRTFLGRENLCIKDANRNEYLDWVYHKQQKLYPAEDMDQLVEMVTRWIKE